MSAFRYGRWWLGLAVLFLMTLHVQATRAGENEASNATPAIDNVGFMKNPPKELVDRFPMCDAFLNVEWIDEEKKIGVSRYTLYREDGTILTPEIEGLVHLDSLYAAYDYSVEKYCPGSCRESSPINFKPGEFEELHEFIKEGENNPGDFALLIYNNGKGFEFIKHEFDEPYSLADHQFNVCIIQPDKNLVWLIELKQVGKIANIGEKQEAVSNINASKKSPNKDFYNTSIDGYDIIDFNHDGKDDYYSGSTIYSVDDEYYELVRGKHNWNYFDLRFLPLGKECKQQFSFGSYIISDCTEIVFT